MLSSGPDLAAASGGTFANIRGQLGQQVVQKLETWTFTQKALSEKLCDKLNSFSQTQTGKFDLDVK